MKRNVFVQTFCCIYGVTTLFLPLLLADGQKGESSFESKTVALTLAKKASSLAPFTGKVIGNKVRLRTAPSMEAYVVRETLPGEYFSVVDETDQFFAILPPKGTKGYVFRTFVLDNIVEADKVNIRLYPDIEAPVIGQLHSGDRISAVISDVNNKWLEIDLDQSAQFYISKEYIENVGPLEILIQKEARKQEAWHFLSSAFHLAQSEIQKPFEEIDLERVDSTFDRFVQDYADFPEMISKAQQIIGIIHDAYIQKKISFLELRTHRKDVSSEEELKNQLTKLLNVGYELQQHVAISLPTAIIEENRSTVAMDFGETREDNTAIKQNELFTDKMLVWLPFEESLYHMWAASGGDGNLEDFYQEEHQGSIELTGIIEPYNRPVKNRPGDYILRCNNLPVGFLYSTKVNLQDMVGKQVTIIAAPRPNNNFAFPAYFVHSLR